MSGTEKNAAGNKRYIEFYAGPDYALRSFKELRILFTCRKEKRAPVSNMLSVLVYALPKYYQQWYQFPHRIYAKITIGTITPEPGLLMPNGLANYGTFFNNEGGEITIDKTTANGLSSKRNNPSDPFATFTNAAKITIYGNTQQAYGLYNGDGSTFDNNTGGEIKIDNSTFNGLWNYVGGTFNNAATITIGATASTGFYGLYNQATFNNNTGESIFITQRIEVCGIKGEFLPMLLQLPSVLWRV